MKLDKETKQEIQDLRTKLNQAKKCLNAIEYAIEHHSPEPYDYGADSDTLLGEIKQDIQSCKIKL